MEGVNDFQGWLCRPFSGRRVEAHLGDFHNHRTGGNVQTQLQPSGCIAVTRLWAHGINWAKSPIKCCAGPSNHTQNVRISNALRLGL